MSNVDVECRSGQMLAACEPARGSLQGASPGLQVGQDLASPGQGPSAIPARDGCSKRTPLSRPAARCLATAPLVGWDGRKIAQVLQTGIDWEVVPATLAGTHLTLGQYLCVVEWGDWSRHHNGIAIDPASAFLNEKSFAWPATAMIRGDGCERCGNSATECRRRRM
ncbi:hypothetical protein BOSE62_160498 [Bosea sp. 62]|nr:hypothetical protein BOSE21B_10012 [Bosea sp. 21B]CAD5259199.1 hypothetical protein BOSE7B_130011 [Bosea sp. 7B]CAD5268675.1 hypothetical protein BOSE46_150014 [Bosea sp. 46]VVT50475.1 hypothetical protein BOS5A_110012 [Bosea sp. EC-HK365B]VXB00898.1 hypothetical protein BOSE127_10197 [Bosea sp. 127]VXC02916.1 hypothetical protein BOSE62_160498 [Bosea sp. 62]VXC08693.1 hypothetical protein BOSE29B_20077 [Bosea sp. 29B]VXC69046.1 hypothetical protein BOSE125_40001 [Bosea sp. 125]